MLEAKGKPSIKKVKEITLYAHLINKLVLVCTQETCHFYLEVIVLINFVRKQHRGSVSRNAILQQLSLRQCIGNRFAQCTRSLCVSSVTC